MILGRRAALVVLTLGVLVVGDSLAGAASTPRASDAAACRTSGYVADHGPAGEGST